MANATPVHSAAVFSIKDNEDGSYKVQQLPIAAGLPTSEDDDKVEINWGIGLISIKGYLHTSTLNIGVEVYILGFKVGNFYGNLKDGVGIDVHSIPYDAGLKLYLKNGNQLWVNINVHFRLPIPNINDDYKILEF